MIEIQNFNFKIQGSRLTPIMEQPFNKTKSDKEGFRLYNKFLGFVLTILGYATRIKSNQSIYYINKNSLLGWMNAQLTQGAAPFTSPEKLQECLNRMKERKEITTPTHVTQEIDPVQGQPKPIRNLDEKFKNVANLFVNRKPLETATQNNATKPNTIPDQNQHKQKMSSALDAIKARSKQPPKPADQTRNVRKPLPNPKPNQKVQLKPVDNQIDELSKRTNALKQAHLELDANPNTKVQIKSFIGCYMIKGDPGTSYSQHEPHCYVELLSNGIDYNKISPSFKAKISQQEFSRMVNVNKNINSPNHKPKNKPKQVQQGLMHTQLNHGKKESVIFLQDIKMVQKSSKDKLQEYEQKTLEVYRKACAFAVNNNYTSIQMPRIGISKLNLQQANQHGIDWNKTVERLFLQAANEYVNKGQLKECILVITDN